MDQEFVTRRHQSDHLLGERLTGWWAVNSLEWDSKGGPGGEPIFSEFRWVRAE